MSHSSGPSHSAVRVPSPAVGVGHVGQREAERGGHDREARGRAGAAAGRPGRRGAARATCASSGSSRSPTGAAASSAARLRERATRRHAVPPPGRRAPGRRPPRARCGRSAARARSRRGARGRRPAGRAQNGAAERGAVVARRDVPDHRHRPVAGSSTSCAPSGQPLRSGSSATSCLRSVAHRVRAPVRARADEVALALGRSSSSSPRSCGVTVPSVSWPTIT